VDQQGHVYISGYDSDDIHRLSPDGTFRDLILSKHDGVDGPWVITFNNDIIVLNSLLIVLPERAPYLEIKNVTCDLSISFMSSKYEIFHLQI
jgi:hypothetical protein